MNCEVCHIKIKKGTNRVVCSDKCSEIRSKVYEIIHKYKPTNGCDNCWGDLHYRC